MRILIVGARGFLGSALFQSFKAEHADVTCLTRGALPPPGDRATWYRVDHNSQRSWDDVISRGFDMVCHLGWSTVPHTAEQDPLADLVDNVGCGVRLLTSIRTVAPRTRLVFASSGGAIYGRVGPTPVTESHPTEPISAYGVSKLAFESYARLFRREHGIMCCNARISNAYGPGPIGHQGFGAIPTFIKAALARQPIRIYGTAGITRDYIYISDVCTALSQLAAASILPEVVNVASGVAVSLQQIIDTIEGCLGRKVDVEVTAKRSFDVPRIVLDISRMRTALGWEPAVSLKEGIARTIAYLRS